MHRLKFLLNSSFSQLAPIHLLCTISPSSVSPSIPGYAPPQAEAFSATLHLYRRCHTAHGTRLLTTFVRKTFVEPSALIPLLGHHEGTARGSSTLGSRTTLQVMISRMAACTISMVDEWKRKAIEAKDKSKTIEMAEEFKELTANIIAHTSFGTSFAHGREAFKAQTELQMLCAASSSDIFIPGTQYLPTKSNLEIWKLDRKMKKSLKCIIESRLNSQSDNFSYGDDLLGIMMDTKNDGPNKLKMNEIMEECKTFFFAGHETTSNWLVWTVFLLSLHKDWQDKLRQEILDICGMEIPDADMLSKLKMVNMVLLEALRLYCPAIELERMASKDMKLGNLMIPKGTCIKIPIAMIHRSTKYWGEDANEFNPMRFINGVSKAANHPNALLAFSVGPRNCIGQNFAMLEAKTVMSLILQRFSWSLSPEYQHAPVNNLTLQPQHGLPIIIKPLQF
ncbi:hypothetical protein TSUD_411960 [Trifolium subterraneum]|uniref:Cytochrome P450 n=1 Tax=Trifolium subterraneum TaxID=3900 RepID=A0A2Z6PTV0_TRISU|nr:hypothetical protein TSUD_411960 [Trifolium subterraneum]